jgi:hypothetical protein
VEAETVEVEACSDREHDVQATARIFSGLVALERRGELRLRIRPRPGGSRWLVRLRIARGEVERQVTVDLNDFASEVDQDALRTGDAYFKRSLPEGSNPRLRPFGLAGPVATGGTRRRLALARLQLGLSRRSLEELRRLAVLPRAAAFERPPGRRAEPLILYQVRLWPPKPARPDLDASIEQRVALVRALKKAFGRRFVGGLLPTPFARANFPELITKLPSGMRAWPGLVRRPLVGVYSEGLHRSVGFKMSEYLAASLAVVADRIDTMLPQPLQEGRHYLAYDTPDDCVAACARLLSDRDAAQEMRQRNWAYYRAGVEPAAQMRNLIETALGEPRS